MHLQELGIATLTSCFVNANRDPKSEPAKPSDFFYFTPQDEDDVRISPMAANAFFALADAGKLPAWAVAIAPIEKLKNACDGTPISSPRAWVGDGVVLILPSVDGDVVKFALGLVDSGDGDVVDVDSGEKFAVTVDRSGCFWMIDGEFVCQAATGDA
ncbi:hypothetical protein ACE1AT_11050 [Pelatocladus sp. BLCC-F211]|uniref:hypothetical protein n=1 Tax=Pelatocladus sp. BLCC-F211 TaxID=3342752 RepID=UPI0035BB9638